MAAIYEYASQQPSLRIGTKTNLNEIVALMHSWQFQSNSAYGLRPLLAEIF